MNRSPAPEQAENHTSTFLLQDPPVVGRSGRRIHLPAQQPSADKTVPTAAPGRGRLRSASVFRALWDPHCLCGRPLCGWPLVEDSLAIARACCLGVLPLGSRALSGHAGLCMQRGVSRREVCAEFSLIGGQPQDCKERAPREAEAESGEPPELPRVSRLASVAFSPKRVSLSARVAVRSHLARTVACGSSRGLNGPFYGLQLFVLV